MKYLSKSSKLEFRWTFSKFDWQKYKWKKKPQQFRVLMEKTTKFKHIFLCVKVYCKGHAFTTVNLQSWLFFSVSPTLDLMIVTNL